jgi:hypothetical protein
LESKILSIGQTLLYSLAHSMNWTEDTVFSGIPKQNATVSYPVHLPNDTLSIAFENTVFSVIPNENATISVV